jgi:hypothetical protein
MNREVHVRFWEGLGVRFPRATQLATLLTNSWIALADATGLD